MRRHIKNCKLFFSQRRFCSGTELGTGDAFFATAYMHAGRQMGKQTNGHVDIFTQRMDVDTANTPNIVDRHERYYQHNTC